MLQNIGITYISHSHESFMKYISALSSTTLDINLNLWRSHVSIQQEGSLFATQEEDSPHHEQTVQEPWIQTFSFWNCEKVYFYCLNHPLYDIVRAAQAD